MPRAERSCILGVMGIGIEEIAVLSDISSVAAAVYRDERFPQSFFGQLVANCRAAGISIAGVMHGSSQPRSSSRHGTYIEDLSSGHRMPLFEGRGKGQRGAN